MNKRRHFSVFLGFAICAIFMSGCSSWIQTKEFTLEMPMEGTQGAKISVVSVMVLPSKKPVVDRTGAISGAGGSDPLGVYFQTDADMLRDSLQSSIRTIQEKTLAAAAPEWSLYAIVRSSMENFYGNSGLRKTAVCIAWCLADKDDQVLYHEQFFLAARNHLFQSLGNYRTSINKSLGYRIARRALILATNPENVDFRTGDDPDTYDYYLELIAQFKGAAVWKDYADLGEERIPGQHYRVVRSSGGRPGWEVAPPLDDIDWKAHISAQKQSEE